jgi:maleylacetoacetate isomerase
MDSATFTFQSPGQAEMSSGSDPVLHGYYRSSAAFRVRIALHLKNIPYRNVTYRLRDGEQRAPSYLLVNAQGLVPSLEIDDIVLTQSLAIIEYLDETRPAPPLRPRNPQDRAHVNALAQLIACDIHPIDNLRVLRYLRHEFQRTEEDIQKWYNHWIARGFEAFESRLAPGYKPGNFCWGEQPTIADICLIPQAYNARNYALDMSRYPTIQAVVATALQHPAFSQASPENQPDAEPSRAVK